MGMLRWQDHELTGSANLSPTNFCPVDTVAGSLCAAYGNKATGGVNMQSLLGGLRCSTHTSAGRRWEVDSPLGITMAGRFGPAFMPCWPRMSKLA